MKHDDDLLMVKNSDNYNDYTKDGDDGNNNDDKNNVDDKLMKIMTPLTMIMMMTIIMATIRPIIDD